MIKVKIMQLETLQIETPELPFRWRDSSGNFHNPSNMETRHLFYTLRMIWNHSMPEDCRIESFKRFRFQAFYTAEYMQNAIIAIGSELFSRSDLQPSWKAQLDFMASNFARRKPLLRDFRINTSDTGKDAGIAEEVGAGGND